MITRNELTNYLLNRDLRNSMNNIAQVAKLKQHINSYFNVEQKVDCKLTPPGDTWVYCAIASLCASGNRPELKLEDNIQSKLSFYLQISLMFPKISWDRGRPKQSLIQYLYDFLESRPSEQQLMRDEIKRNFNEYLYLSCLVDRKFSELNAVADFCEFVRNVQLFQKSEYAIINKHLLRMLYYSHNNVTVEYLVGFFNKNVSIQIAEFDKSIFHFLVASGIDNDKDSVKLEVTLLSNLLLLVKAGYQPRQDTQVDLNDFKPILNILLQDDIVVQSYGYPVLISRLNAFTPNQTNCDEIIEFFSEKKRDLSTVADYVKQKKLRNLMDVFSEQFEQFAARISEMDNDEETKQPLDSAKENMPLAPSR